MSKILRPALSMIIMDTTKNDAKVGFQPYGIYQLTGCRNKLCHSNNICGQMFINVDFCSFENCHCVENYNVDSRPMEAIEGLVYQEDLIRHELKRTTVEKSAKAWKSKMASLQAWSTLTGCFALRTLGLV